MKNLDITSKDELLSLKESLTKILDDKIANASLNERINNVSNMPFGEVRALFEGVVHKLFDAGKNNIIATYVKQLTENKALSEMYSIYESLRKPMYTKVPQLYLNEMIKLSHSINKQQLNEGIKNLRCITQMALLESNITAEEFDNIIEESNNTLNESINYLVSAKKTVNNLNEYLDNFTAVENHINESMISKTSKNSLKDYQNLDDLFDNDLSLWENKAMADFTLAELKGTDKTELFENYKNDCLATIEEALDTEDVNLKSRLSTMKEQINNKKYNKETIIEDILKFSELKELLN